MSLGLGWPDGEEPHRAGCSGWGRTGRGRIENLSGADRQREDPKTHARQRDHQDEHRELAPERRTAFWKDPERLYVTKVNADDVAE